MSKGLSKYIAACDYFGMALIFQVMVFPLLFLLEILVV